MSVFVDTSALYALLDGDDAGHERALRGSERILREELLTHSYVVVETVSLVRRRLGPEAAARLIDDMLPAIKIAAVTQLSRVSLERASGSRSCAASGAPTAAPPSPLGIGSPV